MILLNVVLKIRRRETFNYNRIWYNYNKCIGGYNKCMEYNYNKCIWKDITIIKIDIIIISAMGYKQI